MYRSRSGDPGPVIVTTVAVVLSLVVAGALFAPSCVNNYASVADRYFVEGVVSGPIHAKMQIAGTAEGMSGSEKFSVPLVTASGKTIYNCTSTQCASLADGDGVRLSCFTEWHVFEPDEVECRFDSLVAL